MATSTNITNLLLLSALSSTVVSLSYENSQNIAPTEVTQYKFKENKTWSYNSILENNIYNTPYLSEEQNKINAILKFSNELVSSNVTLDPEFSKIVDDNFWDLL